MLSRNILLAATASALLALSACGGGGSGSNGSDGHDTSGSDSDRQNADTRSNGLEGVALPDYVLNDSNFLTRYPPGNNHWDRDTVQNLSDNCPLVTNPKQLPANTELPHLQKF